MEKRFIVKVEPRGITLETQQEILEYLEFYKYQNPEPIGDGMYKVDSLGYDLPSIQHVTEDKPSQRLFVDMDGTLAVFKPVDTLEILYQPGYFRDLEPHQNVIHAVKQIIKDNPEIEVNILSSYLRDSAYALDEKNEWLDTYLPEIGSENRLFVPCGEEKKSIIPDISEKDFLLDDYTKNLNEWEPPAKGIKLINGINNTRGTWTKASVDYSSSFLKEDIISAISNEKLRERTQELNKQQKPKTPRI